MNKTIINKSINLQTASFNTFKHLVTQTFYQNFKKSKSTLSLFFMEELPSPKLYMLMNNNFTHIETSIQENTIFLYSHSEAHCVY